MLLAPYPYTDPDRILVLGEQQPKIGNESALSLLDQRDWKQANSSFSTIASTSGRSLTIADTTREPERYQGGLVSWDLFPMLGVSPLRGQLFRAEDDVPGAAGVVLLGYDVWMNPMYWVTKRPDRPHDHGQRLQASRGGRRDAEGIPRFPHNQKLWIPLGPVVANDDPRQPQLVLVRPAETGCDHGQGDAGPGRDRQPAGEGISSDERRLDRASADAAPGVSAAQRHSRHFAHDGGRHACPLHRVFECGEPAAVQSREPAEGDLGAHRARRRPPPYHSAAADRKRRSEPGQRAARNPDSRRSRTKLIAAGIPPDQVPARIQWRIDWRSLTYTLVVAAATALLFGLFPALQVSRGNLHENLKEGTRGNSASRSLLRSSLVVVQVSLALVSLVGALLFVRTFLNLDSYNFGFSPARLMTMRFSCRGRVPADPAGAKARRVEDIVRRVEALPGVTAAFSSNLVPLGGGGGGGQVEIDGRPMEPHQRWQISMMGVTPPFPQDDGRRPTRRTGFHRHGGVNYVRARPSR